MFVPGGCTEELQPLDLSVNDYYKKQLKQCFSNWYSEIIIRRLTVGGTIDKVKVDLRTFSTKPIHAKWLIKVHASLSSHQFIIIAGFNKTELKKIVDESKRELPVDFNLNIESSIEMDLSYSSNSTCEDVSVEHRSVVSVDNSSVVSVGKSSFVDVDQENDEIHKNIFDSIKRMKWDK